VCWTAYLQFSVILYCLQAGVLWCGVVPGPGPPWDRTGAGHHWEWNRSVQEQSHYHNFLMVGECILATDVCTVCVSYQGLLKWFSKTGLYWTDHWKLIIWLTFKTLICLVGWAWGLRSWLF